MAGMNKTNNYNVTPQVIDFVSMFGKMWIALQQIMGISRPIKKVPGSVLKYKVGSINLEDSVAEGENILFSEGAVNEVAIGEATVEKYAASVSIESIKENGYDVAVGKIAEAFRYQLTKKVMDKFYDFLNTGALTNVQDGFQKQLAMAKGLVVNKFQKAGLVCTDVVGFVNTLDLYEYLGEHATYNVESQFGFTYIKNFLGYSVVFVLDDDHIPRGTVIATPVNNIVNYYVDPSDSDFARAGLVYTTDGETNLVGYHMAGNYHNASSEMFAIMGLYLFAEYLDGIAVVTAKEASIGTLVASTEAGTAATGDSKVTITTAPVGGGKFYFKSASGTAPNAPTYLDAFDATGWTAIASGDIVSTTNGHKFRIVEVNGTGQAVATVDGTVVAKA